MTTPSLEHPPLRSLTEVVEAKEWIVMATTTGSGELTNHYYWTRRDPDHRPQLALRPAEHVEQINERT